MLQIYCDGACVPNPGRASWAFVAYENGVEIYAESGVMDGTETNNRAEMTAALRAFEWLGGRPGRALSDSRYLVDGLSSWCKAWARRDWHRKVKGSKTLTPVLNADLWKQLLHARRDGHAICWVRGHAGNAGNERADRLAAAARKEVFA